MALGVRYRDSFLSVGGTVWTVAILQEGYGSQPAGSLNFPKESPLEIEWPSTDKLEPVQCSNATLKLLSESDREFVDLYAVENGEIRLDVYRDDTLYWSGCLDTELYCEPYHMEKNYEVTLTFSDLACLDRVDWSGTGFITVQAAIEACLDAAQVNYGSILKHISTCTASSNTSLTLSEVRLLQENFYDEDDEPMTAMAVLESILQPFALRIVQKAGNFHVYDLNAMHSVTASEVEWDGNYSELSADKVYNNVTVTFSPYADSVMMEGKVEKSSSLTSSSGGTLIYRDYQRDSINHISSLEGFRFHHNTTLESNMTVQGGAHFFQICPIFSGSEETGVVESFKSGDNPVSIEGEVNSQVTQKLITPSNCGTTVGSGTAIIQCPRVYLGYSSYRNNNYLLKVALDCLFDVRYNPFEDAGDYNDNASWSSGVFGLVKNDGPYQNMQDWCNFAYIPIKLTIESADGTALYHYENRNIVLQDGYDNRTSAHWVSGAAQWNQAYLCYYDWEDRKSKCGFGGWRTNKRTIGYYRGALPKNWQTIGDGEYISLPPCGGYLHLEIGRGVYQYDYQREVKSKLYDYNRWILFKKPTITICGKNYKEESTEDIQDSAWLLSGAKEKLDISTIIGTCGQSYGVPNGKGQIFDSTGNIYSSFKRAGHVNRLERLLIGTAYSQYAQRGDILSGEVQLLPSFGVYADGNTSGKFILLSELQRCIDDVSEIEMVTFNSDTYTDS